MLSATILCWESRVWVYTRMVVLSSACPMRSCRTLSGALISSSNVACPWRKDLNRILLNPSFSLIFRNDRLKLLGEMLLVASSFLLPRLAESLQFCEHDPRHHHDAHPGLGLGPFYADPAFTVNDGLPHFFDYPVQSANHAKILSRFRQTDTGTAQIPIAVAHFQRSCNTSKISFLLQHRWED